MARNLGVALGVVLAGLCASVHAEETIAPALKVGDLAPEFCALDDTGRIWESRHHVGPEFLVVYFYPSDFSFCCTRQAVRYRDRQQELEKLGAKVIGISGDSVETHQAFKAEHDLNFSLLSDSVGSIAGQFDVPIRTAGKPADQAREQPARRAVTFERCTLVIGRDGRILYRETSVSPIHDADEVLAFLRK
ncbi:MAG TPA: peroxiredoxin [Planctomycetaceae bacterium]|nr:peroxiredoxin [Planctomycetaceae bacterium]